MCTGTPYCFVIITADAPARSGKTTLRWMVLPALVAVVTSAWIGIGSDERYVFGGLRAAPDGVYETFVHRPLAYRVLVWMLDLGPRLLTSGNRQGALAEAIIRAETMVGVAAVCALVWAGLRRYRPGPTAGLTPCALWVAFVLAGNWTYLEPDWAGALWAVAAIGAALLPRRAPVAAPLAAVCVLLCMATKLSTAPYVLIAGGAVWLLDRRRTYASAAWAAGLVALWLFGTWRFQPLEWQWLQDMSVLFPNTPLYLGLHDLDWRGFGESAANLLIVSPIVLAVPAAAVAMARRGRPWLTALGVVAATVLIAAAALAQGEWYLYQWAALPIFAAGLAAYTTAPFVFVPAAAGGALSAFLLSQPVGWRNDHLLSVTVVYFAIAAIGVVPATRPARVNTPAVAVALVLAFGATNLPGAGYSFAGYHAEDTNISRYDQTARLREEFAMLRGRIGSATPVLYLAFGETNYLLGNPTDCRYPSPLWLQRSTYLPYVRDFPSYRDNLNCLTTAARYLIVDRSWFDVSKLAPEVAARLADLFDCDGALHVNDDILACPRR
jgi:hypothetical protein